MRHQEEMTLVAAGTAIRQPGQMPEIPRLTGFSRKIQKICMTAGWISGTQSRREWLEYLQNFRGS
jgi:hypothetical protein